MTTPSAFALLSGVFYIGLGFFGLDPGPPTSAAGTTGYAGGTSGYLLGSLPVTVLQSLLHVAAGVWGISAATRARPARRYTAGIAGVAGALTIVGLLPGLRAFLGLPPAVGDAVWLHGATALGALLALSPSARVLTVRRRRQPEAASAPGYRRAA
jgi:hypothetical protein